MQVAVIHVMSFFPQGMSLPGDSCPAMSFISFSSPRANPFISKVLEQGNQVPHSHIVLHREDMHTTHQRTTCMRQQVLEKDFSPSKHLTGGSWNRFCSSLTTLLRRGGELKGSFLKPVAATTASWHITSCNVFHRHTPEQWQQSGDKFSKMDW